MNKKHALGVLMALCCGCQGMNNTEAGALGGGLFGGALGAVVGAATHHPLAGAAIGAAAGTATGALVGNSQDRADQRAANRAAAIAAANPPLSLYDVANMTQQHISDAVIIQQMRMTNSVYSLTPSDITWLKQQGVSDGVVIEMQGRRQLMAVPGQPVYVVPPPVVGVGVGVGGRW